VRFRLSLLMFLMFAVMGAWVPLFTVRLAELGFTPWDIALASATAAMSYLAAPVAAGQMADRWFPAQRCLALGSLVAGALLWLLAGLEDRAGVFWTCLLFWAIMVPVITIGNALTFSHVDDPARDFGKIRVWGTFGWVLPGWLLGLWWSGALETLVEALGMPPPSTANIFHLGAIVCWVLAAYALTLPHTPPQRHSQSWLAPLAALKMVRHRDFTVYLLTSLGLYMTIPFNTQMTPLLLQESSGIPRSLLAPLLTIGQTMEVAMLVFLPYLLSRLGVRGTMLLGLVAWTTGLSVFALGRPTWLVVAALLCNGIFVACFMVAGQVFLNSRASGSIRASTQSLLVFVNGVGLLIGNLMAGWVRELTKPAFAPTYQTAVVLSLALLAFFVVGFSRHAANGEPTPLTPAPFPAGERGWGKGQVPQPAATSCAQPAENLQ
jgi:MFS family permease